jgi:hypothetical protein
MSPRKALLFTWPNSRHLVKWDYILFFEYFHGDNGAGLGASHQTGWTGVAAKLIELFGRIDGQQLLEAGKSGAFAKGRIQDVAEIDRFVLDILPHYLKIVAVVQIVLDLDSPWGSPMKNTSS